MLTALISALVFVALGCAALLVREVRRRRRYEQQLQSLADNAPDFVFRIDRQMRYVFVNQRVLDTTGMTREQCLGHTSRELGHPEELCDLWERTCRMVFETKEPQAIEFSVESPGGERFFQMREVPEFSDDGSVHTIMGITREVTDCKKVKADIQRLAEQRTLALESAYLFSFDWNIQRNEVCRYESASEAFPVTEQDAPDSFEEVVAVIHPDDRQRFKENVDASLESGRYENEYRVVNPDGKTICLYDRGRVEYDADGRPLRLVGLSQDITERRQALEALEAERARLQAVLDALPVAVWIANEEGAVVQTNREVDQLWGCSGEPWSIANCREHKKGWWVDSGKPLASTDWALSRAVSQHKTSTGEIIDIERFNGERGTILNNAAPVRDSSGRLIGGVAVALDITDQRRAERNLAESEARLRLFIEHAPAAMAMFDLDMCYLSVSRRWRETFNQQEEELIGRNHYDVHPEMPEHLHAAHRSALEGRVVSSDVDRYEHPETGVRWSRWAVHPWRDAGGEVAGIIIFFEDITEQKRAENVLRESERFNQAVLDSLPAHIAVIERTGTVVSVNARWRGFAGENGAASDPMLAPGVNYLDVCRRASSKGDEQAQAALEGIQAVLNREQAMFRCEYSCQVDGRELWFLMLVTPVAAESDMVILSHLDVSERRRAEEALRKLNQTLEQRVAERTAELAVSEQKYRGLVENTRDITCRVDADGVLCYVAPQAAHYGFDSAELEGRHFLDIIQPEDRERLAADFQETMNTGEVIPSDFRVQAPDGTTYWFEERASLLRETSGRIAGVTAVLRDVTARKQAEGMIQQYQEHLRQLAARLVSAQDEEQRRIAEGLHDDVAQILAACSMKLGEAEYAGSMDAARPIHDEIDVLLNQAVDKLRSLSFELSSSTLYRVGFRKAVLELCESMSERYGIQFLLECEDGAAELNEAVATVLFKAVRELLFNVVKHAHVREAAVYISLDGEMLKTTVEDRGTGFLDLKDGQGGGAGRGLGLFGIKERLRDLGGQLQIVSQPGTVTRVTLRVPIGGDGSAVETKEEVNL